MLFCLNVGPVAFTLGGRDFLFACSLSGKAVKAL